MFAFYIQITVVLPFTSTCMLGSKYTGTVYHEAGLGPGGGRVGVQLMSEEALLFRFSSYCKTNVYYGICMYMIIDYMYIERVLGREACILYEKLYSHERKKTIIHTGQN